MFEYKKENIGLQNTNPQNSEELIDDSLVTIHTMQDDFNALRGVFPKKENETGDDLKVKTSGKQSIPEVSKNSQYFNPFLDNKPSGSEVQKEKINASDKKEDSIAISGEPAKETEINRVALKLIWTVAILVIIASFSFGGYYFWSKRKASLNLNEVPANNVVSEKEKQTAEQESTNEQTGIETIPKYSPDRANYLSMDTENPSYENLKKSLLETYSGIKESGIEKPVEFIITDGKNNPVSFSVFSAISGIKLSSEIMKNLGDNFSLFISSDAGSSRIGVAVDTTDQNKTSLALKNEEAKIVNELMPLFLDDVSVPKGKIVFKDNNYKSVDIRYFNLIEGGKYSIDYAFIGKRLVIGTSKNSTWAVLDNILNGNSEK
ncbi:MAG: hypothetical protein V1804_04450 [Patescibacteria group bacterium]